MSTAVRWPRAGVTATMAGPATSVAEVNPTANRGYSYNCSIRDTSESNEFNQWALYKHR